MLASRFELGADAEASKAVLLDKLEQVLVERRAQGEITALVVDEAQSLSDELLEEIRLLANIETADEKLLPLVLAGQPELSQRLEGLALRQLKQRVALRCELSSLDLTETAAYVATRIRMAGGTPSRLFTREAVSVIHEHSGGIPRTISVICDNALVGGMALERQPVDRSLVLEVCRDFHLRHEAQDSDVVEPETSSSTVEPVSTAGLSQPLTEPGRNAEQMGPEAARPRRFAFFGSRR
jgi:general secretion pathway protein A